MGRTTQFKFLIENKEEFEKDIKSKGVEFGEKSTHSYTYFEIPKSLNLNATLRIKESKGKISTDMKVKGDKSGEYNHFEVFIEDVNQMKQIYSNLGCKPLVTFHKSRRTFKNDLVRLDFDSVNELGTFLEVKFSKDKLNEVQQFLERLGLDINKADKRSNIDIYLEKNNNS